MKKEYLGYIVDILEKIVNIPSPSGFVDEIMDFVTDTVSQMGYTAKRMANESLVIDVPGKDDQEVLAVAAHLDTLGAMVTSTTNEGFLKFTSIGGYMMHTIEGEYCKIHSRSTKKVYTGTILTNQPSVHVYDDAHGLERVEKNMEIRIDECVSNPAEVEALGIGSGDYISFDPRFVHTQNGYIKSRHLDDKASAAVILGYLKYLSDHKVMPNTHIKVLLTGFEELGRGACWIPEDITKMLALDMGCVGKDLSGSEMKVTICAKDSGGPYDYHMTNELIDLAKENGIDYTIDVFPHYASDATVAMRAGHLVRCALIGQGVHASHSMERTHEDGIYQTFKLLLAYTGVN